ncbi:MAG: NADH-quinone oxidoreductase subunit L, partial [Dehalococcoidia bacterium]|nr:NADH-quinone oxidoreductase subunit L [Dehalococcoidia bacterium]
LVVDPLTAIMLVVVSLVALLVQVYSQGYMHGDPGYVRYYAWMSLFTASMLGLVLAGNLLMMYVFWELVGLCSYLLIGFWFHRPSAANAAKKAFLVTRLGDFGFLAGILVLYYATGTFDVGELSELAKAGTLGGLTLTMAAIGIFSGAMGKSAQFPLHVWLPDAMEGPTPVSALIHAATMVAAGVYLVARTFPLFEHSEVALLTVACIGAFTAIFAATMGLVMHDIKRVVAYSTISQLGYMMLGLGAGGVALGIFHLFTHAYFKALLFLGSGSVNHATGTFDMRLMGGLRKYMPWTFATFLIASVSLAGIWPLAGFWSKDEILAGAWEMSGPRKILFFLALITVFMTAFYIFRVVFLTFTGEYRGGAAGESHGSAHSTDSHGASHAKAASTGSQGAGVHGVSHGSHGPHESPAVMVAPLVVLTILAIGVGWVNLNGWFTRFLEPEAEHGEGGFILFSIFSHPLPWISLIVALLGIFTAYAIYGAKWLSAESIGRTFGPVRTLFYRKYYMDELYEQFIVGRLGMRGVFAVLAWFDTYIVDGIVNGVAWVLVNAAKGIRKAQSGQVQAYGLGILMGVLVIVAGFFIFG